MSTAVAPELLAVSSLGGSLSTSSDDSISARRRYRATVMIIADCTVHRFCLSGTVPVQCAVLLYQLDTVLFYSVHDNIACGACASVLKSRSVAARVKIALAVVTWSALHLQAHVKSKRVSNCVDFPGVLHTSS